MDINYNLINTILNKYGEEIVNEYRRLLYINGNNASGNLGNSIRYITLDDGTTYELEIVLAEQWKYLEYGRKPNSKMPPIQEIKDWIKIKPVLPRVRDGKLPTTEELAYLISKSIAKKGLPARHYLENTVNGLDFSVLEEAIDKDTKRNLEIIFEGF